MTKRTAKTSTRTKSSKASRSTSTGRDPTALRTEVSTFDALKHDVHDDFKRLKALEGVVVVMKLNLDAVEAAIREIRVALEAGSPAPSAPKSP